VVTHRTLRRWSHRVAEAAGLIGLVVGARVVLGVWPAAVVLAGLGLGRLLVLWARVEAWASANERRPQLVSGAEAADHVAFARALAVVAEAYLADCEREARP
jgi:hypothetical protein